MQHFLLQKMKKKAIDAARENPIVFDADCPETTQERALKSRRVNPSRNKIEKRA